MSDVPNTENLKNLDFKTRGSTSTLESSSLPGFMPASKMGGNLEKYRVRYLKLNMDELPDIAELEKIETKAIHNAGCFVLSKKEFAFMDKIFILVNFLEEI